MNQIPVTLVHYAQASHATAAWFIPSANPAEWLMEIGKWGVAFDDVRICLLPRSPGDRRVAGALAILPAAKNAAGNGVPLPMPPGYALSPLIQPYGCIAGRIYLPCGARLHPPMADEELESALPYALAIFHPSIGLIGFTEDDILVATDLLAQPNRIDHDWDRADPGIALPPPLRSVMPMMTLTIQQIQEDWRDDIGSEAPEEMPPLPDESKLRTTASKLAIGGLSALSWLASHLPRLPRLPRRANAPRNPTGAKSSGKSGAGATPGWRQRLQQWSAAKIAAMQQSLAKARNKELARLLNLLENDMDEALKYALPLHGNPGRGLAPPGGRLTPRNTDFDPSAIGRAGPVDSWDTSNFHQQLRTKYRQAANRELGLGRYRRAAYIFAQLLGDYGAAANALKQGRFYREAATLYQEQLKNDSAAAECLESGGLFLEAIPIYESLAQHEKVGDLYAILQRTQESHHHYRIAVTHLCNKADSLAAARLLETKLNSPDEAIDVLESAWPLSHQASACLREIFELLGRLSRHEQATRRLEKLRPQMKEGDLALTLCTVLPHLATSYPSPNLRAAAADATRIVVGNRLSETSLCGPTETQTLLSALMRLAPEDRLLARDANRFGQRKSRPISPLMPHRLPRKPDKTPILVRSFHLGNGVSPRTVYSAGDCFYAIAAREDQLMFIRGRWDGTIQSYNTRDSLAQHTHYRIESAAPKSSAMYALPLRRKDATGPRDFVPDKDFPPMYLQQPPDAAEGTIVDLCRDEHNVLWSLRITNDFDSALALYSHDESGRLLATHNLDLKGAAEDFAAPCVLAVRDGSAFILEGEWLDCIQKDREHAIHLHRPARQMIVSNPHVRTRLIITFDKGAAAYWPEDDHVIRFAEDLLDPVACFTAGGALVVIGRGRGMILRMEKQGASQITPFEYSNDPPAAIVPTNTPNGYAIFAPDGLVRVMNLPPE